MALRERLEYLLDLDVKGFVQGTKQAGDSIDRELGQKSTGVFGGIKDKGSSAFASIKQNAGLATVAAGGALVAFGAKAVAAFTDAAIAAGNFADSTGVSTEQASKWLSVADDMGLNGETVQKAFLKMNKEIGEGGGLVEKYGIKLKTTASGAADVNGTMLETIRVIGGIKDPTERAAAAQEVFGRSYAEIAEIVLGSADDIAAALETTSKAQIFDAEEVAKAKRYRATMDELGDVVTDLSMEMGESLLPVVEFVADALFAMNKIAQTIKFDKILGGLADVDELGTKIGRGIRSLWDSESADNWAVVDRFESAEEAAEAFDLALLDGSKSFGEAREAALKHTEALDGDIDAHHAANVIALKWQESQEAATGATEEGTEALDEQAEAAKTAAEQLSVYRNRTNDAKGILEGAIGPLDEVNDKLAEQTKAADEAAAQVDEVTDAFARLRGEISIEEAWNGLADSFDAVYAAQAATIAANEEFGAGSREAAAAARDEQGAVNDLRLDLIDLSGQIGGLPDSTITRIDAQLNRGDIEEAERAIATLTRARSIAITARTTYIDSRPGGPRHTGGRVAEGKQYDVLAGEVFVPDTPGRVVSREDVRNTNIEGATVTHNNTFNIQQRDENPIDTLGRALRIAGMM